MIEFFLYLVIFIFGLIIGSFLNCVIYRLEVEESPFKGKSYCPKCRQILKWYDLIPVLSFIILRSRCRYCKQKISWQYPWLEISTGIIFVLIFNPQNFLFSIFYFLIFSFLIIIFVYDLKHYIIPDKIIYPAIIIAGIFNFQLFSILSAILAALFFGLLVLITQGKGMGIGDIKLAFLMGLILGWPNILIALFLAFFLGAIIGIGLIVLNKKTLKSEVPFAPFLIISIFVALFWGEKIINWYWYFISFLLK
jgi:prepilin signal peptidase PulO-like enzyme (type II secretory pathway)